MSSALRALTRAGTASSRAQASSRSCPEVHDSLSAAGGIADGRGAEGVALRTRFFAATETHIHPIYQSAILYTHDGGQTTVRAKLFDELKGPNLWPGEYDGRSIVWRAGLPDCSQASLTKFPPARGACELASLRSEDCIQAHSNC